MLNKYSSKLTHVKSQGASQAILFESIMALGRPTALDRLQKLIEMMKVAV